MKVVFCIVILIFLILMIYPAAPELSYLINQHTYSTSYKAFKSTLSIVHLTDIQPTLFIPQIGVSAPIVEGNTQDALLHGAWHIPDTGTPFSGNMVIAGHRFEYLPPNNTTFYNLDKLKIGELVFVEWENDMFTYQINSISIVKPTDIEIESPTTHPTLTLYTCTPLWTATDRLVITAKEI